MFCVPHCELKFRESLSSFLSLVFKLITAVLAPLPYKLLDAPLIISIDSMLSSDNILKSNSDSIKDGSKTTTSSILIWTCLLFPPLIEYVKF